MSSRLTTIPLPSLAIDPVIYSYGGEPRWIFTDERFRPNGWLLLHRESLSDTNLNAFLRDGALDDKDEVFFKLAHHFELADHNITTDWWRPWNDSIPLRDALYRGGFLKAFEVTRHMRRTNYSFNIYNPAHPIWMAAVHQDAWGTSVDRERAELAAALGDMLIPRWRSYDAHQKTLYEENLAMRMLICTGAAFDGAYQSLKGTLNALWEVGKVVLEAAGSMLKAHVQFVTNLAQGEFEKIANDLAQFGLDAGRSVAEFQEKLERGMERLNLILSDGVSRSMIWQFFDGMKESLSTTNKYQIVGAIGLEVILGLATFGTSVVIKAGVMIGGLTVRVFRALCKLAERLVAISKAAKQAIVQASDRVMDFVGDLRKGAGRNRQNDNAPGSTTTSTPLDKIAPDNGPAAGPVNFMADTDQFFINASKRSDIDPEGYYDVVAHGSPHRIQIWGPNGSVLVDHRSTARLIQQQQGYNGQKIRLFSCSTGACDTGLAQNLANKLNLEVQAPTDLLWAYPDGRTVVAPRGTDGLPDLTNIGEIKTFLPRNAPQ